MHTSDWHVGRTFHRHRTLEHLEQALNALADGVREHDVDVVLVAGDLFDLTMPAAEHYEVLDAAFARIREAGAVIVATPGNHDSASRLGFQSAWAARAGVHVLASWPNDPVVLHDEHGPVFIVGIPYLEPAALRVTHPHLAEDGIDVSTADATIAWAMDTVRGMLPADARSVVLAHCFVGAADSAAIDDAPKDITVGGQSFVSANHFEGIDYTALGHLHSRRTITESVRYCGAPLYYSFRETSPARGAWIVDLDAAGLSSVSWFDLPIDRRTVTITGELETLLTDPAYDGTEDAWVRVVLTDAKRPADPMARLQRRWPHCAVLQFEPPKQERPKQTYRERLAGRTDIELISSFLDDVRDHEPMVEAEREIIADTLAELKGEESQR